MAVAQRTVVWIASYPKSGNTWVRFLACNLIHGPQDSAAELNRLAPDVHELGPTPVPPAQRVLMKTHFLLSPRLPLVSHTAAAVYVVRHPADVMLSNFHYSKRSGATSSDDRAAFDRYVEGYIAAGGDPRWLQLGMGTWADNARSWFRHGTPFPILRLRYEDLLANALGAARTLCSFLELDRTAEEIGHAVSAASFERLREIEQADIRSERVGIFYKPYLRSTIDAGLRFMRSGRSGEAERTLSIEQQRRFRTAFAEPLHELGYIPDHLQRIPSA